MSNRRITIITPTFNEELNVQDCYKAVKVLFQDKLCDYEREHIFCDNASTDGTPELLRKIAAEDKQVKVILNARNYGPFRSTFNGLRHATGDGALVMLAADLQDPPEMLAQFVEKWEEGFHVVYGIRANREEGVIMRHVRRFYYNLVNRFADIEIPLYAGEFQFIDRKVLDSLMQFDDHYPYIRGMVASCGFRTIGIPYTWKRRKKGMSKNRLYHLIDQGLNGLISFSNVPTRIGMFVGLCISALSFLYTLIQLIISLILGRMAAPGITTIIVAVFFFGGVQIFFLGFLGEYIGSIHAQVRKRPLVTVLEMLNFNDER
jgi:glycosyltransferase involved in cell wall biosynthesis